MICQAADENMIYHLPPPGVPSEPNRIKGSEYWEIVRSKPDVIYLSPAFEMKYTRSPRAVQARKELADLRGKERAGVLCGPENQEKQRLLRFTQADEE
jgi:hypothetical protein